MHSSNLLEKENNWWLQAHYQHQVQEAALWRALEQTPCSVWLSLTQPISHIHTCQNPQQSKIRNRRDEYEDEDGITSPSIWTTLSGGATTSSLDIACRNDLATAERVRDWEKSSNTDAINICTWRRESVLTGCHWIIYLGDDDASPIRYWYSPPWNPDDVVLVSRWRRWARERDCVWFFW